MERRGRGEWRRAGIESKKEGMREGRGNEKKGGEEWGMIPEGRVREGRGRNRGYGCRSWRSKNKEHNEKENGRKHRKRVITRQRKGKSAPGGASHAATHPPRFSTFRKSLAVALDNAKARGMQSPGSTGVPLAPPRIAKKLSCLSYDFLCKCPVIVHKVS